jgi:hypothetical protein
MAPLTWRGKLRCVQAGNMMRCHSGTASFGAGPQDTGDHGRWRLRQPATFLCWRDRSRPDDGSLDPLRQWTAISSRVVSGSSGCRVTGRSRPKAIVFGGSGSPSTSGRSGDAAVRTGAPGCRTLADADCVRDQWLLAQNVRYVPDASPCIGWLQTRIEALVQEQVPSMSANAGSLSAASARREGSLLTWLRYPPAATSSATWFAAPSSVPSGLAPTQNALAEDRWEYCRVVLKAPDRMKQASARRR